jgi:glycopeptide antibiotics resistance protein
MTRIHHKSYRLALLVCIVLIIPFGYSIRFASGLGLPLLQDIIGSLAYQVLLMLLVAFFYPRLSLAKVAVGVFIFSAAIEFLQLWQSPFIQAVRATWAGRVILGNTFTWADFPPYALGCLLGWVGLRSLRQRFTHSRTESAESNNQ